MTHTNRIAERWTAMWNRQHPTSDIITADCAVYFGRQPTTDRLETTHGPAELQAMIDDIAARVPGIAYSFDSRPLHEAAATGDAGIVTLVWEVGAPGRAKRTGIDILRHRDGLVTEVWSITGDLPLPPLR